MVSRGTTKLVSAVLGLCCCVGPAGTLPGAQAQPAETAETISTEYQYAAKALCSLLSPHQDGTLARGTYRTIVNIHNPSDKPVTIAAKVALATPSAPSPARLASRPSRKPICKRTEPSS